MVKESTLDGFEKWDEQSVIKQLEEFSKGVSDDIEAAYQRGLNEARQKVAEQPTIEAEPVKHGRWIVKEQMKLIQTGKMAVLEGHILSKTSADSPFTEREANLIRLKEHRVVKIPYCSICGNHGDDEWDRTLFCPNCGARMEGSDTNA